MNVAIYSALIGKWMSLPQEVIKELTMAALLHDIGKSKIPNNILDKKMV